MSLLTCSQEEIAAKTRDAKLSLRLSDALSKHILSIQSAVKGLEQADKDGAVAPPFVARVDEFLGELLSRPEDHREHVTSLLKELKALAVAVQPAREEEKEEEELNFARRGVNKNRLPKSRGGNGRGAPKARLVALFAHRDAAYQAAVNFQNYFSKLSEVSSSVASLQSLIPESLTVSSHHQVGSGALSKLRREHEASSRRIMAKEKQLNAEHKSLEVKAKPLREERDRLLAELERVDAKLADIEVAEKRVSQEQTALSVEAEAEQQEFDEQLAATVHAVQTSRFTFKVCF